MNILFLDAYYEPETIAYTHLENDLIEELILEGHRVYIICPIPTRGITDEIRKRYKKKKDETKYGGKVIIERFWAPKEGKNPLIRAFRYLWCNLRTYQKAVNKKNIDVVFSNSTPPTQGALSGLVAKKMSKKVHKKISFIYNLQDIFPDSLVNAKMTKKGSMIWKIGRKIEDFTYKSANKIIVISEDFKDNVLSKGVSKEKIEVIPNWINTENVYPINRDNNVLFDRYNLDRNKFYICYSGNLGHSQNFNLLVRVAEKILTTMPNVAFILVGEGAAKESLEAMVCEKKLTNIVMLPFQPYKDIAQVFSLGDVGLIISKPGIGGSSVPSKTWSIMAAERPVLASFDKKSQLWETLEKVEAGVISDSNDEAQFIKNIEYCYQNRDSIRTMGKNGRRFVTEELNKNKCVKNFIGVISGVVPK